MLSCYRASEATDPESFIAEATAVLSRYPEDVARRVSYGLPSESKWLPSIAEIREACDRASVPKIAEQRRQAERARTAAICGRGTPESAERRKQVADEMRDRLAALGNDPNSPARFLDPRALSDGPAKNEALARLEEQQRKLAAEYASNPVALSDRAKQIFTRELP